MKKILMIVLGVGLVMGLLLASSPFVGAYIPWDYLVSNSLDMEWYRYDGSYSTCSYSACGPSAGVSIGRYYTQEKGYDNLPHVGDDYDDMYEVLYDEIPTFFCYSEPLYYGYGFVEMTQDPDQNNNTNDGYYNFGYVYDDDVDGSDFWDIVDAINNGWPIALNGNFWNVDVKHIDGQGTWPPTTGHYIAIKGYGYHTSWYGIYGEYIICTDSLSRSNQLEFYWSDMVNDGSNLHINIIKDEIPEDFEWGYHGEPLSDSGGDVDWTVTADGDSYAEISVYGEHEPSTRCGKFYYDGDSNGYNYARGYYDEVEPIWRGFWFKTDGNTVAYTRTGNGQYNIMVRVLNDSDDDGDVALQYYDYRWHTTNKELKVNHWHFIEFRAIDWDYHHYSIYVDGNYVRGGRSMYQSTAYNDKTAYYAQYYEGSFSIDDISSSWW